MYDIASAMIEAGTRPNVNLPTEPVAAGTSVDCTWSLPQASAVLQNLTGADLHVRLGGAGCNANNATLVLGDGEIVAVGRTRPARFQTLSLFSATVAIRIIGDESNAPNVLVTGFKA